MNVRREYLFLQLVCLDLRITCCIHCGSVAQSFEIITELFFLTHLLRVLSRKSVSKSSHPATRPMQTPRKARQKTKRRAPMTTEPVRLLHLKQHEFTTGILPRSCLHLQDWSISFLMVGMLIHFSYPMVSPVRRPQPRPCWLSMSHCPSLQIIGQLYPLLD